MDYLLALLIAFPGVPLPERVPPAFHEALVQFATRHDLSAPSEGWVNYPFRSGVRWCSTVLLDLKDAPGSTDSLNFPPAAWCDYELARNAVYIAHLAALADFVPYRRDEYEVAIYHAERIAGIWWTVLETQRGYVAARRHALRRLRAILGEADYHAGILAPAVPD